MATTVVVRVGAEVTRDWVVVGAPGVAAVAISARAEKKAPTLPALRICQSEPVTGIKESRAKG